jgi:RNA polymerase sigma-70 factor (ECF subfamily)
MGDPPDTDHARRRSERPCLFMLESSNLAMPQAAGLKFRTTSWTLVLAASANPTTDSRAALAALCEAYWGPVYAFVRRSGYDAEHSQDLTQSFFALVIEKQYLHAADRQRGRFRSFLLGALKHFLANEWDRAHALKRGGGITLVSIDREVGEGWYAPAAVEETTPESLFQQRWALSLLDHVMRKLRTEFTAAGKERQFDTLSTFLNRGPDDSGYDTAAEALEMSAGAVRMAVHRLRKRFRDLLRAEIAETVTAPEEIDDEIRFLLSTLST